MAWPDPASRSAAQLAAQYGVEDGGATAPRYAAVVRRDGRARFVSGDDIDGLLALGELVVLVDLDARGR